MLGDCATGVECGYPHSTHLRPLSRSVATSSTIASCQAAGQCATSHRRTLTSSSSSTPRPRRVRSMHPQPSSAPHNLPLPNRAVGTELGRRPGSASGSALSRPPNVVLQPVGMVAASLSGTSITLGFASAVSSSCGERLPSEAGHTRQRHSLAARRARAHGGSRPCVRIAFSCRLCGNEDGLALHTSVPLRQPGMSKYVHFGILSARSVRAGRSSCCGTRDSRAPNFTQGGQESRARSSASRKVCVICRSPGTLFIGQAGASGDAIARDGRTRRRRCDARSSTRSYPLRAPGGPLGDLID